MKKIILLTVFALMFGGFSYSQCNDQLVNLCAMSTDGATYIKDFKARMKKAKKNEPAPVAKYSVVLNKNTVYRFNVCNATEFAGKAIIQLYDAESMLGSNYNVATGKDYASFDFYCKKSGIYQVFMSFKGGEEGCAAGILSFVGKEY